MPGAPPRQNTVGAAIGLSFLDSALRLNHIRRLSETLTVTDHRVARRTTEIDISLAMLDEGQRRATMLSRDLRSASRREDRDSGGRGLGPGGPHRPPQHRAGRHLGSPPAPACPGSPRTSAAGCSPPGLFRLLRGILDSLPGTTTDSELHLLLHRVPEAEWLLQHAIDVLVTERHRPPADPPRPRAAGVVAGQGARYRAIALAVLDKHEHALAEFFELLDVALDNDLLIVALDPARDEHVLTYETPLHVTSEEDAGHRFARLLRSSAEGYHLEYRSSISSSIPAYHLVVDAEPGVDIARMYLSTDTDARTAAALRADLLVLAAAAGERAARADRPSVVQDPRAADADDAAHPGRPRPPAALGGRAGRDRRTGAPDGGQLRAGPRRGLRGGNGRSGRRGRQLRPAPSGAAARAVAARRPTSSSPRSSTPSVALENDPSPSRAHASWHGCSTPTATAGAPVEIRAGMLLRDTTAAGPRRVCQYAVLVAVVGFLFAAFLAGDPWPFGAASRARLGAIGDADAVIGVLLLVPGFLYTRLGLADQRSISGRLRALPRAVANVCIAVIAVVAATVASGLSGGWVQLAFATMVVLPLAAATLLLYRRRPMSDTAELVRLGAPQWLAGADVGRVRADARFFSVLGGAR